MNTHKKNHSHFRFGVYLLVFCVTIYSSITFAIPEHIWQRRAVGELNTSARAITTDNAGNVIISGLITDSAVFDSITATGRRLDIFVAKYNTDGVIQWVQTAGSPYSNEVGWDVATDSSGAIYITGQFENVADFGTTRLRTAGQSDIFIAKYDPAGNAMWARRAGGFMGPELIVGSPDGGRGIAVDNSGNVYITGHFRTTADFSGTSLTSDGETDLFLAKYTSDGVLLWVTAAGGSGDDFSRSVAVDNFGNAYIAGQIDGTATFAGRVVTGGRRDLFVAKYLAAGTLAWVKRLPVSEGGIFKKIRISPDNNLFVTGGFAGSINLDSITLNSLDYPGLPRTDMFIAKMNTDGDFQWAKSGGGHQNDFGTDIGFERSGNVFVIGDFKGEYGETADFEGIRLSGDIGASEIFMAEYQSDGHLLEVDKLNIQSRQPSKNGISLADNRNDQIFIAGTFQRLTTVSGDTWDGDIFVSKLRALPRPPTADECETGFDGIGMPCVLSPWQHIHWRCTRDIRRALGEADLLCPGVFENGPAPRSAEDIWYIERLNMALESATAEDFYSVRLPDPADAMEDGHPDIRSSEDVIASGDPEPLIECGAVRRVEFGIAGRDNRIYVSITGMLNIKVEPQINSSSRRAFNESGESIHIYRGTTRDDSLASGRPLSKTIICPRSDPEEVRSGKGLREVRFSVGERSGPRDSRDTGGYKLNVEYIIKAVRGIPQWVLDFVDERNVGAILPLPCTDGLGGFGGANFPFCTDGIDNLIRDIPLPFDPQNNCIADGPGCWELFSFQWPHNNLAFSLSFFDAANLDFELFDVEKNLIASTMEQSRNSNIANTFFIPEANAQQDSSAVKTLMVDSLARGQYFLIVNGEPGTYSIEYALPETKQDQQQSRTVIYLALFILILLLLALSFRFARTR